MTREDEIKLNARWRADQYDHPAKWSDTYYGFISGAEWADAHPHWISVEEEPKINPNDSEWDYSDDVLVALKDGSIAVGRYERDNSTGEHYWVLYGVDKDLIVTHWMQISPPPKKGGEK